MVVKIVEESVADVEVSETVVLRVSEVEVVAIVVVFVVVFVVIFVVVVVGGAVVVVNNLVVVVGVHKGFFQSQTASQVCSGCSIRSESP